MDQDSPIDLSGVVELRQYTLHRGRRDALLELFDRHFVDGQEACGIRVLGQFRDADDPDRFVWVRGFRDLAARADALAAFYDGPVWRAHREAANATMIDSDNVLVLRPVDGTSGLAPLRAGLFAATVYLLRAPAADGFARLFDEELAPLLAAAGAAPIARFVTETAPNNFPRLPVREGVEAFVSFAAFADDAALTRAQAALAASPGFAALQSRLHAHLLSPPQTLRLQPTSRSALGRGFAGGDEHDFDFLPGRWTIANRRLRARGAGCTTWDEFAGASEARAHLGGVANSDENDFPARGFSGMTVRAFDRARRLWSIYWIDSVSGRLAPPVVGGFDGNRGTFVGDDVDGERPVRVVFTWTRRGPDAARWEQAFSYDGGRSWETNWIMELNRS